MTTTITINGQDFEYPVTGDTSWGSPSTNWAQAVSLHLLQKTGGAFTLTADVNFGATFGLISPFYKSATTPRSGTGVLRLANTDKTSWRNFADSADLALGVGTDNLIEFGAVDLALVTQLVTTFIGLSDTPSNFTSASLQAVRVNSGESALEYFTQTFLLSSDTPSSYSSNGLDVIRVNTGETALEFVDLSTSDIDEGTNLYYTDSRVDSRVQGQNYTITGTWGFNNTTTVPLLNTTGFSLILDSDQGSGFTGTLRSNSGSALSAARTWDLQDVSGTIALTSDIVSTFLGLSDAPSSFSGQSLLGLRVNAGETAVEFAALTVSKTFQDVYDDDASVAAFDLDVTTGEFVINNTSSQALLTIKETGVPFTVSDLGVEKMTVEDHGNPLFGTFVGFNNQSVSFSSTSSPADKFTLERYDLTGVGGLTLLADFAASPTPRMKIEDGNQRIVFDNVGNSDADLLLGGGTPFLRLRGGSGTDKRGNVTFISNNPSDQTTNWIGAVVDDTSIPARLFSVRPATDSGTVFTREDSRYIDFFDGSTVRATIQRNGVMTGPMNSSYVFTEKHNADSAAGDASAEHIFFKARHNMTITTIIFMPDAALTADDTNFATLTVYRRDDDGTNQVIVSSADTTTSDTGSWPIFEPVDLGALTTTTVATDELLTFEITKSGTGVIVPSGTLQVEYDLD